MFDAVLETLAEVVERDGSAAMIDSTVVRAHDVQGFRPLMRMVADRIDALLADKGYDADVIRDELADAKIEAVIPAKANRRNPAPQDRVTYRWRNPIERLFNKLKNWRRVATRYDKNAESYLGFVSLVSALLWLPFVHAACNVLLFRRSLHDRCPPATSAVMRLRTRLFHRPSRRERCPAPGEVRAHLAAVRPCR